MKHCFLLCIALVTSVSYGQIKASQEISEEGIVYRLTHKLDEALIDKDTATLNRILHKDLSMGHSNGWIESKSSLLNNLPTSKVKYDQFVSRGALKVKYNTENLKIVCRKLTAIGEYEGEHFEVDLKILEIWKKENDNWLLLARQSVGVDF